MRAFIRLAIFLLLALLIAPASVFADSPEPELLEPPRMPERPAGMETQAVPLLSAAGCPAGQTCTYLPLIQRPNVNQPRQDAVDLYNSAYLGSAGVPIGWNGSISSCTPGTTSQAFRDSVLLRINYFRQMAGIPLLGGFRGEYNTQDQAAALMMAANQALNHTPPTSWSCYTQTGYDGASSSNLALGAYGPNAISLYMSDGGVASLGHRRWILYPQTREMGSGDISGSTWDTQSNALKAWDSYIWEARPSTTHPFVAWPPPGYVPYQVVYPVWSFAVAGADFSGSSVTVTSGGAGISTTVTRPADGYGENTLAFKPCNCSTWPRPAADTQYQVTISNVKVGGVPRNYSYTVTVIEP